jgi:hypothetical protein
LFLGCAAGAHHGFLDFSRRILVDLDVRLRTREQHDASRVAEHDCRSHVFRVENVFDGDRVRLVARNQLGDTAVNFEQPVGKRVASSRANHAALEQGRRA